MGTTSKTGLRGSVTRAGVTVGNIKNWSLTIDVGSNDTTAFGESNASFVQGLRNASGQIAGDLSTDAQQSVMLNQLESTGTLASAAIILIASTVVGSKSRWTASAAMLTNIQVGSEIAGVCSFSASFACSGGVTYSTA